MDEFKTCKGITENPASVSSENPFMHGVMWKNCGWKMLGFGRLANGKMLYLCHGNFMLEFST